MIIFLLLLVLLIKKNKMKYNIYIKKELIKNNLNLFINILLVEYEL